MSAPASSRRALMAAGAALPVTAAAAVSADPDAEVKRLAAATIAAHRAYAAAFEPAPESKAEERARQPMIDRLSAAEEQAMEALHGTPAVTLAGVIAKAFAAYEVAEQRERDGSLQASSNAELLLLAVLEDVLALGGFEVPGRPTRDDAEAAA